MRLARSAIQPPPSRFTASTRTRSADQALYPTRGGGWLADWGAGSRRGSFTVSTGACRLPESMRHAPPQLLQPGIAAAAGSVELVPHRILDVEILVIVLGRPELSGRHDRCDDVFPERFRLREHCFGRFGAACWAAQGSAWARSAAASRLRKRLMLDSSEGRYRTRRAWPADRIRHTVMWSALIRQNSTPTAKKGETT